METIKVPKKLLKRLPVYLHYIRTLPERTENISATRMAKDLGLGDVMVRKDLAKVSDGGRRKLGYVREALIVDIEKFLDLNSTTDAIVIGAGKLGQALLGYSGFEATGLHIVAGFDIHASKKHNNGGKPIYPMTKLEQFCQENQVAIAIITVPAESAQSVCDELIDCGVRAIWNFAPAPLRAPKDVVLKTEDLAASLAMLAGKLYKRDEF